MSATVGDLISEMEALQESYTKAHDEAKKSIEGQLGLFILGCVLRIGKGAQHAQGEVKDQVLYFGQHRLQRLLVPGGGAFDQDGQFLICFCVHNNTS